MNQLEAFHKLLRKYRFVDEIPFHVQKYAVEFQKKILTSSLKQLREFSFLFSFVLAVYFCMRKIGLSTSLTLSKLIVFSIIVIIPASLSGGIIYILANYNKSITMYDQNIIKSGQDEKKYVSQKYRLGISPFMTTGIDKKLGDEITKTISHEFSSILGEDNVLDISKDRKNKKVNLILIGSIGKMSGKFILSARIVNVESSTIVTAEYRTVYDEKDIIAECAYISKRIGQDLKEKFFK